MIVWPRFVDRVYELSALNSLAYRGSSSVLYIYGPEGCGKTRLLKEFVGSFEGVAVYVDALEESSIEKALMLTPRLMDIGELVTAVTEGFTGHLGAYLCRRLWLILSKVATRAELRGKHLVIILDDVTRALGLESIERYIKWLYEMIWKITEEYEPKTVLIIATTSEGYSLKRVFRHTYNVVNLIWNLDHEAYLELAKQLNPPNDEVIEESYKLVGGNPREVINVATLYRWDLRAWLNSLRESLNEVVRIVRSKGYVAELKKLIEDPDILNREPTPELEATYEILLENNLMMYSGVRLLSGWVDGGKQYLSPNLELGVGRYYSWQIPAYRVVLNDLVGKGFSD